MWQGMWAAPRSRGQFPIDSQQESRNLDLTAKRKCILLTPSESGEAPKSRRSSVVLAATLISAENPAPPSPDFHPPKL